MLTVYASLLPVFLLIALGFALRKSGMIPEEQWRGVELLTFWILIPALLITVMSNSTLSIGEAAGFALTVFLTIVFISLVIWLLRRPLKSLWGVEGPAFTSIFQTTTRWHGFIALAIAGKLFGPEGLALLAVAFAVMVPFLNVVNVLVLAAYASGNKPSARLILTSLAKNPLIWAVFIGFFFWLSGIKLPEIAATTLQLAGDGALGVSLLALGAGLSWHAVKQSGRLVVFNTVVKIIVTPLVAIGFALLFGVTGTSFVVAVLATAVPTAVNGFVLARTMGGDAELYAASMTAQVIASFITLPAFMWFALQYAG